MSDITAILNEIRAYVNRHAVTEPALFNDLMDEISAKLENGPQLTDTPSAQLAIDTEDMLRKLEVIGANTVSFASATEPVGRERLLGALRFDRMSYYAGAVSLTRGRQLVENLDLEFTTLEKALINQAGSTLTHIVAYARAENIAHGVRLAAIAALSSRSQPMYRAIAWLRIALRAVVHGRIGSSSSWLVFA